MTTSPSLSLPFASPVNQSTPRLTSLTHGGGCGCKIAPEMLQKMLNQQPDSALFQNLLVGTATHDDAAAFMLDHEQILLATTDFFMPMVDDPELFGQIAATNALSDIYAMGGRPLMALALLGIPIDKLSPDIASDILRGGHKKAAEAGIPIAGGHSIDCSEPLYGLAVIGICKPSSLRKNSTARHGDQLILLKGLGTGIYSAAFKKQALPEHAYQEMVESMTLLNTIGMMLAENENVHAMTDVTGFGLLGHLLEMAQGSNLAAEIHFSDLPLFSMTEELAQQGFVTGASARNWQSYGHNVDLGPHQHAYKRNILTDPQTSGGLLIAINADCAKRILDFCQNLGYRHAARIGQLYTGSARVEIK